MSTLDELLDKLDAVVADTLQQAGQVGVEAAQGTSLFHTSSTFREQIITQPTSNNSQVVWSQAPYSSYLEYGNNAQGSKIYPKSKKALHFNKGGREVFAKWVSSHGPLPYMAQAQAEVEKQLPIIWQQQLDKHFK